MFLLLTSAFALDCSSPAFSGDSCGFVNSFALMLDDQTGSPVITDGAAQSRFRSSTLYTRFETLLAALDTSTCEPPAYLDAGTFRSNGVAFGTWEDVGVETPGDLERYQVDGVIDFANRTFQGVYANLSGPNGGEYGNFFSSFNTSGKISSQYDDPDTYQAGYWIRTAGRNGVFVNLEGGACPNSAESDLAAWFAN